MDRGEEDTWSACVSGKTVKCFLVDAAHHKRKAKQLDFIGAFLQALARGRLWIQLPKEYAKYLPELAHYFDSHSSSTKLFMVLNLPVNTGTKIYFII